MQVVVWIQIFQFLGQTPRSAIAELHGKSIFSFVRTHQTVLHRLCTAFIPIGNEWEFLLLPILTSIWCCCQYSIFLTILISVWQYFLSILICISLITHDMEHLFLCLFTICISSLVKCLVRSLAHFLIILFVFYCWILSSLCILDNSPLADVSSVKIVS